MDEKDLAQIKGILQEAVTPLQTELTSLKAAQVEVKTAADAAKEAADKALAEAKEASKGVATTVERVDAVGKRFTFGRPGRAYEKGAPAYVRPSALGDRPYSIANVVRSFLDKDERDMALELHISEQLKRMNYPHQGKRSILVPLSSREDYFPDTTNETSELRKLLDDCLMEPQVSPEEMLHVAKAYLPGLAKAMDPLNDLSGASMIPFPVRGDMIDLLRAVQIFTQLGAQQIPLPPGGIDYPMETGRTSFARRRLGSQTAIPASQPTTGSVKLTPKELAGLVKIPNSLLRFSNPAVEALVRRALAADAGLAADLDYLTGEGQTNAPLGLLNYERSASADTPELNKVTSHVAATTGSDGDTFQPEDVQLMLSLVEEAPDVEGANAWVMFPRMFHHIANRRADAVSAADGKGPFMFPVTRGNMGQGVMKELAGLPVATSTQVPRTRVKGNGTALTPIITGNFRRCVIGRVGTLELAASSDRAFELNETWIRAVLYDDFALLHPESFVVCDQLRLV